MTMNGRVVHFEVPGPPQPQGSMRPMISRTTGLAMVKSDNVRLRSWRGEAAWEASHAKPIGMCEPFAGAVKVSVQFVFVRPKSVTPTRRPSHTVKPDIDKLTRALFDAMSGIVFRDDAQVIQVFAMKTYGPEAKTIVSVEEIPNV